MEQDKTIKPVMMDEENKEGVKGVKETIDSTQMNSLTEMVSNMTLDNTLTKTKSNKQKKKFLTMYWGIELSTELFNNDVIKSIFESNPNLVPLKKIHSTLLFVGKREGVEEEKDFIPLESKQCKLIIDAYGVSEDALALRVKSITYETEDGETKMPAYPNKQQHITMGLRVGIPAKDSVLTLLDDKNITPFDIELTGTVKRYLY